jgi:hypothetical protein
LAAPTSGSVRAEGHREDILGTILLGKQPPR